MPINNIWEIPGHFKISSSPLKISHLLNCAFAKNRKIFYQTKKEKDNTNYVLSKNLTKEVSVKYGETVTVKFDNTHKEGSLKIN